MSGVHLELGDTLGDELLPSEWQLPHTPNFGFILPMFRLYLYFVTHNVLNSAEFSLVTGKVMPVDAKCHLTVAVWGLICRHI
jgi:hypothetical protein